VSPSEGEEICINPYWTVEEGDVEVNNLEVEEGFMTVIRTGQPIVVRIPEASFGSAKIEQGSSRIKRQEKVGLFRITPSQTETAILHIPVAGMFGSLLLVCPLYADGCAPHHLL